MSQKCSSVLAMNEHTKPRKQNLFEVGFSLVSKLLKPFIKKKPRKGLGSEILPKIELVLRENVLGPSTNTGLLSISPPQSEKERLCKICISKISGPGMKKKERSIAQTYQPMPKLWGNSFQFYNNCH